MGNVDKAAQFARLQLADQVSLEIAERIQERRDMGYMHGEDEKTLAAYRRVLADLALAIEIGQNELGTDRI